MDHDLNSEVEFRLVGADIFELDNATLATGAATMANVCTQMRKLGYISREEYVRLVYKFAGEEPDPEMILEGGEQSWNENEYLTFMSAINNNNGDIDTQKYNTTTIADAAPAYEQGYEK